MGFDCREKVAGGQPTTHICICEAESKTEALRQRLSPKFI